MAVKTFVNHLTVTQADGKGIIRDFGYTDGKTRLAMVADFLANVDGSVNPDAAMLDFLTNTAKNKDVYKSTSDCGGYVFTIRYFEVAEK